MAFVAFVAFEVLMEEQDVKETVRCLVFFVHSCLGIFLSDR